MNTTSLLKKRVLTALVLIPLVVFLVLYLPPWLFASVSGVFFLFAYREWPAMVGYGKKMPAREILQALLLAAGILVTTFLFPFGSSIVIIFWTLAAIAIFLYPKGTHYYTKGIFGLSIGMILLFMAWLCLTLLQKLDPKLALYPLVLVWAADTAAYFIGKGFGKYKLAPSVSPGKTWEGAGAAIVAGILLGIVSYKVLKIESSLLYWVIVNTVVVIFSVIGDLFESIFKRVHGLKDSGNLLPGHGGLLDRIDAQLAALPLFAALLLAKP